MQSKKEITGFDITLEDSLPSVAKKLLEYAGNNRIFTFTGSMGAGKTTFIKALCKALGSNDHFSSPTYSIVNEYSYPGGKLYHFDLYRVKSIEELYDIGFEEYIKSGHYCFIEWPELTYDVLGTGYVGIKIDNEGKCRWLAVKKT